MTIGAAHTPGFFGGIAGAFDKVDNGSRFMDELGAGGAGGQGAFLIQMEVIE